MADDLEKLAGLVVQRARAIESTFARLRAKDFPTHHFDTLALFPQKSAREIRKSAQQLLLDARNPRINPASVARMLRRYGQALEFVHESFGFMVNAEVLSIPAPFVFFLEQLASSYFEPTFVLQGGPAFNYSFLSIAPDLNAPLVQAGIGSRLPERFAVFRFPAALREDGLQHSILAHELGHYLDTSLGLAQRAWLEASPQTQARIVRFIRTDMGMKRSGLPAADEEYRLRAFSSWIREMACDLVGTRLLGPAFLFSAVEFVRFQADLTRGSESHPPSNFRIWVVLSELTQMGWRGFVTPYITDITEPERWNQVKLRVLPEPSRTMRILERCLAELLPSLRSVVRRTIADGGFPHREFAPWDQAVSEALGQRIPPGEVLNSDGMAQAVPARAVLNGAWRFHLDGYETWPKLKYGPLDAAFEKRQLLSRLVLKALEISSIVASWPRVSVAGQST